MRSAHFICHADAAEVDMQPDAASVLQLVVHEVHRPDFVDGLRHTQRLGLAAHQVKQACAGWMDLPSPEHLKAKALRTRAS